MLRFLPFLAIVTILSPGIQTTGTPPVSTWVSLADSNEWGTGGTVADLTDNIPQFRTHEEAQGSQPGLPLDTGGWATITLSACTEAALETALTAVSNSNGTIIDASACTEIVLTGDPGAGRIFVNWSPSHNRVVLRGHANRTVLRRTHDGSAPATTGLDEQLMQIGSSSDPSFSGLTWGLDRGATLNSQVIGTDDVLSGVDEGDILWIGEPSGFAMYGSDASGPTEIRLVRRVLCRRIGGVNVGSDCTGVTTNGDIRLDKPLTMDLSSTGPYHFSSQFTNFEIKNASDAGVRSYIGVENFEFTHSHPLAIDPDRPLLKFQGVNYFWMKNVVFNGASAEQLEFGISGTHTGPGLIRSARFNGAAWDTTCVAAVNSLIASNPVQVVMASPTECTWGATDEPIWFPDDFPIAALRGTHAYTITVPEAGGQITLALTGIDGTGMNTNPGGWGVALKFFSTATVYARAGTSGVEFADVTMHNTRIGFLSQGAMEMIYGYIDLWTDAQIGANRGIFDHSGFGSILVEGVRSNCQWLTLMANSPAAGPGEGPHQTVVNSHFMPDGTCTTTAYGATTNGGSGNQNPGQWFDETGNTSRAGRQNYGLTVFGNVFQRVNTAIDTCDQPGSTAGCADNQASGVYLRTNVHETGNLWITDVDARFDSGNLSTVNPETDAGDANEGTELSVGDRAREYPTSVYRTVTPSWWCTQSGTFPGIGAKFRDAEDSPHPNLPAQIRRHGTTCTPP